MYHDDSCGRLWLSSWACSGSASVLTAAPTASGTGAGVSLTGGTASSQRALPKNTMKTWRLM